MYFIERGPSFVAADTKPLDSIFVYEEVTQMPECTHLGQIHNVKPKTKGCEECLQMGDRWVHLRLCLECGHVGCCDSSKNKHATKHFHATRHPIVRSLEPGETWAWCYVDNVELDFE